MWFTVILEGVYIVCFTRVAEGLRGTTNSRVSRTNCSDQIHLLLRRRMIRFLFKRRRK